MIDNRDKVGKDILETLVYPVHGILELSPRVGKTKLGIEIIKKQKCSSILWVTSSAKLRDEDIPEEFVTWKAKRYLPKTTIIHYNSLNSIKGKFDIVILDEFQAITEANTIGFFNKDIEYGTIVGLTGTIPKHEEKLEILKKLKLKVLVKITIDEAVDQELVADYTINVIEIPMDAVTKNVEAGTKKAPFNTTEVLSYQYLCKRVNQAMWSNNPKVTQFSILARLRFVYNSPSKLNVAKKLVKTLDGRKLVFAGSIKHAEEISNTNYHSKTNDKDLQAFLKEEINLLSCVNAGGTGFTYKNVDHFIIVQSDSNKSGSTTQKLARSLLLQKDYKAQIWILCLMGTQDEKWVEEALKSFDVNKVNYINVKNLKL